MTFESEYVFVTSEVVFSLHSSNQFVPLILLLHSSQSCIFDFMKDNCSTFLFFENPRGC